MTSAFDHKNRRKSIQSSLGAHIQLQHNVNGDITGIHATTADTVNPWQAHIQRNLVGLEIERSLPGGVKSSWTYNQAGLPESHLVNSNQRSTRRRHYRWDANEQLKQIINGISGGMVAFGYEDFGNLAWAQYEDGHYDYRLPDKAANLYETQSRQDRKYGPGGRLLETPDARFIYDDEGNLLKKITHTAPAGIAVWEYEWYGNGMLKKVLRPDGNAVTFKYDPLGRRIEKQYKGQLTRFIWDGRVPLHEWTYPAKDRPVVTIDELGDLQQSHPEPVPPETLATWVFEEDTFTPAAKIINGKHYSLIADHLGTPCEAYDESGEKVWECELDIYGRVRMLTGDPDLVPFRYPGQYADAETGLYYNGYRYYDPACGRYISVDPIRLAGGIRSYGYVGNPNFWIDPFGLMPAKKPPHFALWEHRDASGNLKGRGDILSGGTSPGRTLSWPEQSQTHTEQKILNTELKGVAAGDEITIMGTYYPCNGNAKKLGKMGCQKAMREFADTNDVKINYIDLSTNLIYTFEKNKVPTVGPCH